MGLLGCQAARGFAGSGQVGRRHRGAGQATDTDCPGRALRSGNDCGRQSDATDSLACGVRFITLRRPIRAMAQLPRRFSRSGRSRGIGQCPLGLGRRLEPRAARSGRPAVSTRGVLVRSGDCHAPARRNLDWMLSCVWVPVVGVGARVIPGSCRRSKAPRIMFEPSVKIGSAGSMVVWGSRQKTATSGPTPLKTGLLQALGIKKIGNACRGGPVRYKRQSGSRCLGGKFGVGAHLHYRRLRLGIAQQHRSWAFQRGGRDR